MADRKMIGMGVFGDFWDNWRAKRQAAADVREQLHASFQVFLEETKLTTPTASKYAEAALLRHAWKRAIVLEEIFKKSGDEKKTKLYRDFQDLASRRYYAIAPNGPYGPVRLKIEEKAAHKLMMYEVSRLSQSESRTTSHSTRGGYVYILSNKSMPGLVKIGFTERSVEERVRELSSGTGVPERYNVEAYFDMSNPIKIEQEAHKELSKQRLTNREFFKVSPYIALQVIAKVSGLSPDYINDDLKKELLEILEVKCKKCGAINRVKKIDSLGKKAVCGRCHESLSSTYSAW